MTTPMSSMDYPAGATPTGDGIVVGTGPVTVDMYIDFLCPFCRRFELAAGPTLGGMVGDGLISAVYHPMSFLDAASTTRYSSRAGSASGCASDGGPLSMRASSRMRGTSRWREVRVKKRLPASRAQMCRTTES